MGMPTQDSRDPVISNRLNALLMVDTAALLQVGSCSWAMIQPFHAKFHLYVHKTSGLKGFLYGKIFLRLRQVSISFWLDDHHCFDLSLIYSCLVEI